jgi:FAD:protein FMN transferase
MIGVAEPLRHVEHVMGTVFSFVVRDGEPEALRAAVARLHRIDEMYSTYRPESQISRLARGEVTLEQCDAEVAAVLERCDEVSKETDGYFTAHPGGVLDPSGWVKGWSIAEASRILAEAGSEHHCVTGGGDVQTAGESGPDRPWRVGIADPLRPGQLSAVVGVTGKAVATSGVAERGAHILDPHTGTAPVGLLSVTLVGDRIAETDAWATAVFAMGPDLGAEWAERREGIEALFILPNGSTRWTAGFPGFTA